MMINDATQKTSETCKLLQPVVDVFRLFRGDVRELSVDIWDKDGQGANAEAWQASLAWTQCRVLTIPEMQ